MGYGYKVYYTERSVNRVMCWDPDTNEKTVIAGGKDANPPDQKLRDPYGLCFDHAKRLIIADKRNRRVCRLKQGRLEEVPVQDIDGHRAGIRTARKDRPVAPCGVFSEDDNCLLVAYGDDHTIYRIHPNRRLELVVGISPAKHYTFGGCTPEFPADKGSEVPVRMPVAVVKRNDGTIFYIERGYQVIREYHPDRGIRCVFPISRAREFLSVREVPDRLKISEYHPSIPTGLALDSSGVLFFSDTQHRSVWKVDFSKDEIRKVVQTQPGKRGGGPAAIAFGPDGTLWVMDYGSGSIHGYKPTASGLWNRRPETTSTIHLALPCPALEGAGLACG